ncbi:hypothetical protein AB1I63_07820 [Streptococcus pneumoniae]
MAEEILAYRLGPSSSFSPQEVFEYHFEHLKKYKQLLFTTKTDIKTPTSCKEIMFVNQDKNQCFKAFINGSGRFQANNDNLQAVKGYNVPKQFKDSLNEDIEKGYRWFALSAENVSIEPFSKGKYCLSRIDLIDSLGENQTPHRYVLPAVTSNK